MNRESILRGKNRSIKKNINQREQPLKRHWEIDIHFLQGHSKIDRENFNWILIPELQSSENLPFLFN